MAAMPILAMTVVMASYGGYNADMTREAAEVLVRTFQDTVVPARFFGLPQQLAFSLTGCYTITALRLYDIPRAGGSGLLLAECQAVDSAHILR